MAVVAARGGAQAVLMWLALVNWFNARRAADPPPRWVVEHEGVVIAELDDPRFEDMFWTSYLVVPKPNPWFEAEVILTGPFWDRFPEFRFVNANSGNNSPYAFPAAFHSRAGPLRNGRLHLRGMYAV